MMAVVRELPRDGGESLAALRDRLVQCAQDLKAHGLIEISDEEYVFVPTASRDQPDIIHGRGNRPEESKEQQVESERVRGDEETDTPKETEDPVMRVAEEPQDSAPKGSAEDADVDVLDLTLELEGASAPAKEDAASLDEVEEAEDPVEPLATGWMKPPRFMSLLGQSRK